MFVSMHTSTTPFRTFLGGRLYGDVIEYVRAGREATALGKQADARRLWLGRMAETGSLGTVDGFRVVQRSMRPYAPAHTVDGRVVNTQLLKEHRPDVYRLCRVPDRRGYSRIKVPGALVAFEMPVAVMEPPTTRAAVVGLSGNRLLMEYRELREDIALLKAERKAAQDRIEAVVAAELPQWDGETPLRFADGFVFQVRQLWYSPARAAEVIPTVLTPEERAAFLKEAKPVAPKPFWAVVRERPGSRVGEHGALVGVEDDLEPWEGE